MGKKSGASVQSGLVEQEIVAWLTQAAADYDYLLAHADDGVIWGKVIKEGKLVTANDAARDYTNADEVKTVRVALRASTLQQARLFGKSAECRVWQVNDKWQYAIISDQDPDLFSDTHYLLWGTGSRAGTRELQHGFTLMVDGEQGLHHAVPLPDVNETQHTQLLVRHYWQEDSDTGFTTHAISRLCGLETTA